VPGTPGASVIVAPVVGANHPKPFWTKEFLKFVAVLPPLLVTVALNVTGDPVVAVDGATTLVVSSGRAVQVKLPVVG
jgi:hypothetical protein